MSHEPFHRPDVTPYHRAIFDTVSRYQGWKIKDPKLSQFIDELATGCMMAMPICKANRWLGYIQGVLIERGLTTINEERDQTRPLFRPLDFS